MKGYCPKCNEEIDEVTYTQFKMCEECYNKIQEKKGEIENMRIFWEEHKDDQCILCGRGLGEVALFEVHQIMDSKYVFNGKSVLLCHVCLTKKVFIKFWYAVVRGD